ncbi:MAG: hypothetical protein IKV20_02060 [Clostridia bacterium]|nr:hypothetical protein [Clostridia bacterium]
MKKIYGIFIALTLFLTLSVSAAALEPEEIITEFEDALPEDSPFSELDTESIYSAISPAAILNLIRDGLLGKKSELSAFAITLFALTVLSLLSDLVPVGSASFIRASLSVVLSSVSALSALPVLRAVCTSLSECDGIFLSISSVFSSLTLASGGALGSAAGASSAVIISSLTAAISSRLLPLIAATSFSSSILSSLGGDTRLALGASKLYSRALGILTLLIGIIISTQGIATASADSATIRAIKYGAQSAIPLVGGAVSSTLSLLAGGLGYAKGLIGAGAVGVLLYTFLAPLALLFAYRLIVGVAKGCAELIGAPDLASLGALAGFFDALIASVALSGALYLLEIIIFLTCGVNL